MAIALKRAYEKHSAGDGARVLVDRLWPRGLTKQAAAIDLWLKDLSPSNELRRWYHARPQMWQLFRKHYLEELGKPEAAAALEQLYDLVRACKKVTLVYSSRNAEHNNAAVLKQLLDGMRKPPTGTGPAAAAGGKERAVRPR
jgi:uncharacterized protein YeaO (DUF488 family)